MTINSCASTWTIGCTTSPLFASQGPGSKRPTDNGQRSTGKKPNVQEGATAACRALLELSCSGAMLLRYLARLSTGRLILWCYFLWYFVVLVRYFDSNPRLWLTSIGLSVIIGFALYISTTAAGNKKVQLEPWQTFRLFLMPSASRASPRLSKAGIRPDLLTEPLGNRRRAGVVRAPLLKRCAAQTAKPRPAITGREKHLERRKRGSASIRFVPDYLPAGP